MAQVLTMSSASMPLHRVMANACGTTQWRSPDLLRRVDLLGFDVAPRAWPNMPLVGETCPADWPVARLQDLINCSPDAMDTDLRPLREDSLHFCLWQGHERQSRPPLGVFSCRMSARVDRARVLEHLTFLADGAWIHPAHRGQGLSHYFAALVRTYMYYHVLHPLAETSAMKVRSSGFDLRFSALAGPPAWERLCANLQRLFEVSRGTWWSEQEWASSFVAEVSARWAICELEVDRTKRSGTVVPLRA